jgi:hypothetical protein
MVGLGEGALFISIAAVIITILRTKPWIKQPIVFNAQETCSKHSGIETKLTFLQDITEETRDDVKKILVKIGGV